MSIEDIIKKANAGEAFIKNHFGDTYRLSPYFDWDGKPNRRWLSMQKYFHDDPKSNNMRSSKGSLRRYGDFTESNREEWMFQSWKELDRLIEDSNSRLVCLYGLKKKMSEAK